MKNTWRVVLKVIGLSLAVAGIVCVIVGCWDKLAKDIAGVKKKLSGSCPEFDDYDDDLLYE